MNQRELLNKISDYITTFQLQVKISTRNSLYDINVHSETVMVPLLNILYKCDFKNLNTQDKNADTIDLLDSATGISFQITATNKLEKIKNTLTGYLTSAYRTQINELNIYILTEKQGSYAEAPLKKIIGKKIPFSVANNIVDGSNLFGKIMALTDIDHIKAIYELLRKQFSELYILDNFSRTDFVNFKTQYTKSCLTNFKRLNFFGLSVSNKPREIELYQLFVEPRFKVSSAAASNFRQAKLRRDMLETDFNGVHSSWLTTVIDGRFLGAPAVEEDLSDSFSGLFSYHKHLVILGNPGAGKSSVVRYAICKILEQQKEVFADQGILDTLPIRIELHKYNKIRLEKSIGFITYLTYLFKDEYHSVISEEHTIQVLRHFPTLLFFDGMDEIFDIQERLEVRNDIEGLVKTFEQTRAIVTSRFESYTEVKLDAKLFDLLQVLNFDDDQVKSYVEKWYSVEEQKEEIREAEAKNCLEQLVHVDGELKHNPLLLSLILILYRNELEIPTSKLEIYENCTTTIMDHRDAKEKKLDFRLQITNPLAIFSALAFWQFENDEKRQIVNYEVVYRYVKKYLLNKGQFDDDGLAGKAATQFLEFAKVRSVYFENKFTHKTFLEYFTSNYLYSSYFMKPQNQHMLREVITKNIGVASWVVVLELLISKIDSGQIDFDVIDGIVDEQLKANPLPAALFFMTLLRYLKNISPAKIELLFSRSILYSFNEQTIKDKYPGNTSRLFESIVTLSKLTRFKPALEKSFTVLLNERALHPEELSIFAYEFRIVSGDGCLVDIIEKDSGRMKTDYQYLLKNYAALKHPESLLALITSLIKSGKASNYFRQVFTSYFGQKIFFGSETFNYPISFLMNQDLETLDAHYQLLKDAGLDYVDIISAANIKSGLFKWPMEQLYELPNTLKDRELIRIVKAIERVNFPTDKLQKPAGKFYDRFFRSANGRTRKR